MKHLRLWVILLLLGISTNAYATVEVVFTLGEAQALVVEIQEGRICAEELVFYQGYITEIDQFVVTQNEACEEAIEQAQPTFWEKAKNWIVAFTGGMGAGLLLPALL